MPPVPQKARYTAEVVRPGRRRKALTVFFDRLQFYCCHLRFSRGTSHIAMKRVKDSDTYLHVLGLCNVHTSCAVELTLPVLDKREAKLITCLSFIKINIYFI